MGVLVFEDNFEIAKIELKTTKKIISRIFFSSDFFD